MPQKIQSLWCVFLWRFAKGLNEWLEAARMARSPSIMMVRIADIRHTVGKIQRKNAETLLSSPPFVALIAPGLVFENVPT
jgi:hypothetical protein